MGYGEGLSLYQTRFISLSNESSRLEISVSFLWGEGSVFYPLQKLPSDVIQFNCNSLPWTRVNLPAVIPSSILLWSAIIRSSILVSSILEGWARTLLTSLSRSSSLPRRGSHSSAVVLFSLRIVYSLRIFSSFARRF